MDGSMRPRASRPVSRACVSQQHMQLLLHLQTTPNHVSRILKNERRNVERHPRAQQTALPRVCERRDGQVPVPGTQRRPARVASGRCEPLRVPIAIKPRHTCVPPVLQNVSQAAQDSSTTHRSISPNIVFHVPSMRVPIVWTCIYLQKKYGRDRKL